MKTHRRLSTVLFALVLVFIGGCQQAASSPGGLPTTRIRLGNRTFVLEIANTEPNRERGLMRRDSMPDDHGMIFVFADAQPRPFWMKNTRIPLDIIFLGNDAKVISIKQMKPYDLSETPSDGPAKWAIELNQGAAADSGIKVGDVIDIPPEARDAK